jgi:hypothetical protein
MSGSTKRERNRGDHGQRSSCDELASTLDRWIAGDLASQSDDSRIRAHLAGCRRCAREAEWLRSERAAFARRAQLDRVRPPDFGEVLSRVRTSTDGGATPGPLPRAVASIAPRRDRSMLALGLCAAAALFCVLLPRRDAVMVRPDADVPTVRVPRADVGPRADSRAAPVPSLGDTAEPPGSCEPLASFEELPAARGASPSSEPAARDDDTRVCADVRWSGLSSSGRDDERLAGAAMCGPAEL